MDFVALLSLGVRLAQAGLELSGAALAKNEDEANAALAKLRGVWQEGSDAIDAALAKRNASS